MIEEKIRAKREKKQGSSKLYRLKKIYIQSRGVLGYFLCMPIKVYLHTIIFIFIIIWNPKSYELLPSVTDRQKAAHMKSKVLSCAKNKLVYDSPRSLTVDH